MLKLPGLVRGEKKLKYKPSPRLLDFGPHPTAGELSRHSRLWNADQWPVAMKLRPEPFVQKAPRSRCHRSAAWERTSRHNRCLVTTGNIDFCNQPLSLQNEGQFEAPQGAALPTVRERAARRPRSFWKSFFCSPFSHPLWVSVGVSDLEAVRCHSC